MVAKKSAVKKYVVPFFVSHFSYCSVHCAPIGYRLDQLEIRESHDNSAAFKARRAEDEEITKR